MCAARRAAVTATDRATRRRSPQSPSCPRRGAFLSFPAAPRFSPRCGPRAQPSRPRDAWTCTGRVAPGEGVTVGRRAAVRRGDGGKRRVFFVAGGVPRREIQKSDAREPRCSRRARPGDVRGWPARRGATSADARATYLDLLFRELEFPHVPAGEVPPGALVVELRRLSRPRADDIFGARVRGKGRGAGPPGAGDAALHTHLASSARRRARREPRVPRRASRVARIGQHQAFPLTSESWFYRSADTRYQFCQPPQIFVEGPTLA